MEAIIRLLPYADADGSTNMAADEAMVRSAADGIASLRFYGWTTATVSLGYFQPCAVRSADSRLATLPWVRRPSGGATLVHHHEVTYALALPTGPPWHTAESWLTRMHRIISAALAEHGVHAACATPVKHGAVLCFQQHACGDLLIAGRKVVGSAQRKYRQALMQHGSILLAQSEHTPTVPGIRETAGVTLTPPEVDEAILRALIAETGWALSRASWTESEQLEIGRLIGEKYANSTWNERR